MAAALIPIVASALPDIVSFIASLIHPKVKAAEAMGPGTGPLKFADVLTATLAELVRAHASGVITTVPDNDTVKVILQSVYTSLKLSGDLAATAAAAAPGAQSITLKAGQSVVVTA